MSKPPPTSRDRVDLFLATVARYEEFAAIYELPRSITLATVRDDRAYWMRLIHGAMLRKYVQDSDHVYLPAVITSIERCIDTSNPDVVSTWREIRKMVRSLIKTGSASGIHAYSLNGAKVSVHSLAIDELYGTLLHGDWERWKRTEHAVGLSDLAMFDWVAEVEVLVVGVRGFWELAVRDGLVHDEQVA